MCRQKTTFVGVLFAIQQALDSPALPVGVLKKLMSLTVAYGTVLTAGGNTQYAFLSVTVSESLCFTPASIAHRRVQHESNSLLDQPYNHNDLLKFFLCPHKLPKE